MEKFSKNYVAEKRDISLVIKIIAQQIILKKPISQINISGYFERYFNEELTFLHFTSNIIRVYSSLKYLSKYPDLFI